MTGKKKSEMTFLEHLEELRWHLVRSAIAVVSFTVLAFVYKQYLFDVIILGPSSSDFITNELFCKFGHWMHNYMAQLGRMGGNPELLCLNSEPIKLQNITMAGQFTAHIKISIIAGFILAFPYIVFEIWKFISPALYQKERKYTRGAILAISMLFFVGVLFGYFIISPLSVNFLVNYKTSELVINQPNLMSYVSVVASIALASGIMFELPAIIFFLTKIGLITPKFLIKYRRHAIIILLIIAAIITPPDVFSQILVTLPLLLLYELSILVSKRILKRQSKE